MNRTGASLSLFCLAVGPAIVTAALGCVGVSIAQDKPTIPKPEGERIEPFKIAVEEKILRDLKDRLARTRWPDQIEGSNWEYGVPVAYMKDLIEYWQTRYDWREQEKKLNRFDQFVTRIDGLDIHFIHVRSKEK